MSYNFLATSSRYLIANSLITQNPMTIGFWFRTQSLNGCGASVGKINANQRNNVFVLPASGSVVSAGSATSTGTSASVNSTSTFTNGVWSHACGVYAANNSRTAYCNGGGSATNTTTITASGFDGVVIGTRFNPTTSGGFFTGDLAEIGVWDVALTAAEISSLAKGITCDKIRPESLVFYAPLVRDLIDVVGGQVITNNNGATVADHLRIYD